MKTKTFAGRVLAVAVTAGLASVMAAGTAGAATAAPSPAPAKGSAPGTGSGRLDAHDAGLLAAARSKGDRMVTLMAATDVGAQAVADVTAQVRQLGGSVGFHNDRIGYVRATVPTAKVEQTAALRRVLAVDLNESTPLPDPTAETAPQAAAAPVAGPGPGTPDDNPYLPTNETGAVAFKQAHPTYDGRGITIGVLDSGVDLDHPSLQTTSTGERKITDWVTSVDPLIEGDLTWRAMLTSVTGPTFTYQGSTWTAPPGTYFVNRFSEDATLGGDEKGDVNRDGDTTDKFGVLYRPSDHAIWVDTDQDHDFTDEMLMHPYKDGFQVNHFGTDDPSTAIAERIPFVVEYRTGVDLSPAGLSGTADFVNIGIVEAEHGSHVAGIAAGHSLFGGAMDGAAPGAKIVSSRACTFTGGCTAVALTEGMIDLVANRGVDVVNMSIGGLPALNNGADARSTLYNRLIDEYGVQLFISAGNDGPGVNTAGDPATATDVVSVGATVSKATWKANYGADVTADKSVFNFSSRGPREDGGFKPNITAPGSAISTTPLWEPGGPVPEAGYPLPPGYQMLNGTSMSSPQSAGAAALLLSAGRQTGLPATPRQLRSAIYTTADYNSTQAAISQGHGQFNVPAAWTKLQEQPNPNDITVVAPVCTPISNFLVTPGKGTGLYNRCTPAAGGLRPNQAKTVNVTLTRTSGAAGTVTHNVTLRGNDGAFSVPTTVALPLNKAVKLPVVVKAGAGLHSAVLEVNDPGTSGYDQFAMLAVIISPDLSRPTYSSTVSSSVERSRFNSIFVNVPAGAPTLQVNLAGIATGSQVRFIAINPYGVEVEDTSSLNCYTNRPAGAPCKPTSRSYTQPIPGIWEIEVEARRTTPFLNNVYRLTAAVQGVTVDPTVVTIPSTTVGESTPVSWSVTNAYGPVTIAAKGGPLSSVHTDRPSIGDGQTQTFTVDVPAGATSLDAAIGGTTDLAADLDLYLLKDGVVVAQSADGDAEEAVSVPNPAPGTYVVEVDGYSVPAGTTAYDERDAFSSPALGTLQVPSGTADLAAGQTIGIPGVVTVQAPADTGRQLSGQLQVLSGEGAVLGTGAVVVGSVVPGDGSSATSTSSAPAASTGHKARSVRHLSPRT